MIRNTFTWIIKSLMNRASMPSFIMEPEELPLPSEDMVNDSVAKAVSMLNSRNNIEMEISNVVKLGVLAQYDRDVEDAKLEGAFKVRIDFKRHDSKIMFVFADGSWQGVGEIK